MTFVYSRVTSPYMLLWSREYINVILYSMTLIYSRVTSLCILLWSREYINVILYVHRSILSHGVCMVHLKKNSVYERYIFERWQCMPFLYWTLLHAPGYICDNRRGIYTRRYSTTLAVIHYMYYIYIYSQYTHISLLIHHHVVNLCVMLWVPSITALYESIRRFLTITHQRPSRFASFGDFIANICTCSE